MAAIAAALLYANLPAATATVNGIELNFNPEKGSRGVEDPVVAVLKMNSEK